MKQTISPEQTLALYKVLQNQPICLVYSFFSVVIPLGAVYLVLKQLNLRIVVVPSNLPVQIGEKIILPSSNADMISFPKIEKLSNGKFFIG
jgi:hypothetical protein